MYQAFDSILSQGPQAIPQYEQSMDIGMSASIEAAQTIAHSGKHADSFLRWLDQPCNVGNYTKDVEKIFNPLCDAKDPSRGSGPNTGDSTIQKIRRGIGKAASSVAKGVSKSFGSQDASPESDNAAADKTTAEEEAVDETAVKEEAAEKAASDKASSAKTFADNAVGKGAAIEKASAEKTATPDPEAGEDSVASTDNPTEEDTELSKDDDDSAASSEHSLAEEDTETLEDDDTLATEGDTEADESDTGYESGYGTSDSLERRAKKPKTAKSGKKTTGDGSGKKGTAADSGKKDTVASSGKKDTTAGSGKKDTTSSSKDDSTTGSESTSAAEAAFTTSSSSKDAGDAEEDSTTTSEGDDAALDDSATDSESAGASEEETDSGSKGATNSQKGSAKSIDITSSCPLKHKAGTKGTENDKTLGKRAPPPDVQMRIAAGYGRTWVGFVKTEEVVSNDDIRRYARRGYEHIQDRFQGGDIIVAALDVSGVGVVVASSARAPNTEAFAVAGRLKARAQTLLPAYWEEVKDRTHSTGLALAVWHAEDVAMVLGAPCLANGGQTKIATYGRYRPNAALGPKPPCSGVNAPTRPTCREVLDAMEVSIVPLQ
ncbi:MAG: hypothetical protein Q9224_005721 [Gallowayella concinna]